MIGGWRAVARRFFQTAFRGRKTGNLDAYQGDFSEFGDSGPSGRSLVMQIASQNETICFLGSSDAFGGGNDGMELVSTHISIVLLIGTRALKLKRPVKLSYVDLSTPERRLAMCERELMLNRRTAPDLYRAVHRITRKQNGDLALNGQGELVDAVLEMERFNDSFLFDRMAQEGSLSVAEMAGLAAAIARLHRAACVSTDCEGAGRMERVLTVNEQAFANADILSRSEVEPVIAGCREALARHAGLLDRRAREGKVRRGHGDLHLRNICLFEDRPLLFDCLEFDEDLATVDILYDLAFVLMDLWHRKLEPLANVLFNRYLDAVDDETGLRLLPFFMAVRAAVRAHVTAMDGGTPEASRLAKARAYLQLCRSLLKPSSPVLVAVGGYSGSGKSTLATKIAPRLGPPPGARVAASDRIRKKLCGVTAETRLSADAYGADVSARTYRAMMQMAEAALAQGSAAIADAVFDRRIERERIAEAARRAGVPFCGLWLQVPRETLVQRVAARRGDPSDATPGVVMDQIARHGAATEWTRIPAQENIDIVATAALAAIGSQAGAAAVWPSSAGARPVALCPR
ncbi:bifunctional aminoglycoside phosphotransferase/ATP-binding protein [Bosea sp. (in: a-proteobacteria)]|uniref:bifunctional aminoglycoside phosphotransferase/ATP-binding protein n=1 Tax=Bosea sp. (in: a-proteobacteria) TaxID=1871050 RepID=UPI0026166F08|nr:bifunctional aminoglycoside phosphotransferase/ATP-binding protein [Bosea sp. (in: a-proteobacteria)]MCO5090949.1 AAA family ATPase [Bosea sp. (in: a-proteobacteria)]